MTQHHDNTHTGLARSAHLLHSLGANAAEVWNELDPQDAASLSEAMNTLGEPISDGLDVVSDYVSEMTEQYQKTSVWRHLSSMEPDSLVNLLSDEHPQLIALMLTRIDPPAAAGFVQRVPALLATDILHRILHTGAPLPRAVSVIEKNYSEHFSLSEPTQIAPTQDTVARIFEALPEGKCETLLTALHTIEPGTNKRIKDLMFGFDDLASLTPAGLQTLLANAKRATLILALKGVTGPVADAFLRNMTARARDVLQEDIAALGPQRRTDVAAARALLVDLARRLMVAGEILPAGSDLDEDLIS